MSDCRPVPDVAADATVLERADVAVAKAVAPVAKTPLITVLGTLSEVSDQPEMRLLCAGVIGYGLWRGDARMTRSGWRMLAAHSLATGIKTFIKRRVDRTRPNLLVEEGRYGMTPGDSREHDETSFPSGHTAGAVAVGLAFARDYPEHRVPALAAAAAVSLMQIPRCSHYPSDVGAGAVVGLVAAGLVNGAAAALASRKDPVAQGGSG